MAFLPTDLAGLESWFDALAIDASHGDQIATWRNRANDELNASIATSSLRPTYEANAHAGRPGVYFNGGNRLEIASYPNKQARSVFVVAKLASDLPTWHQTGFAVWGSSSSRMSCCLRANSSQGNSLAYWDSSAGWRQSSLSPAVETAYIFAWIIAGGSAVSIRADGEQRGEMPIGAVPAHGRAVIGDAQVGGGNSTTRGHIFEILVYDRALSAQEVEQVEAYLFEKWYAPLPGDEGPDLWLSGDSVTDGDGQSVTTWVDKSGKGNDVTGSGTARPISRPGGTPGLNGQPTVYADRDDDVLSHPNACAYKGRTGLTVFAVVELADLPGSANRGIVSRDASGDRGWLVAIDNAGAATFIVSSSSTARTRRDGDVVDLRKMPAVLRARYDGTKGEQSIWINGVLCNGTIDGPVPARIGGDGPPLRVFRNDFSEPFGGHAGDIIVYGRALSDAECEAVEADLFEKYQLFRFEEDVSARSPHIPARQGYATDGTHHYTIDTNALTRRASDWSEIQTNADPFAGISGVNHLGDGAYYQGKLYIPMESYFDLCVFSGQRIAVFDAATLAREKVVDITAQGHEASSIAVDPERGVLWVSSFCDGSKFFKYDLATFAYLGALNISPGLSFVQGLTYARGALWAAQDRGTDTGLIARIDPDTGATRPVYHHRTTQEQEGIDFTSGRFVSLVRDGAGGVARIFDVFGPEPTPDPPTAPEQPTVVVVSITTSGADLIGSAFSHPTAGHKASMFVVLDGDHEPAYASGVIGPVTMHRVPEGTLAPGTEYFAAVRYQADNDLWSDWSPSHPFSTLEEGAPTEWELCPSPPATAWEECKRPVGFEALNYSREFQADFETPAHSVDGASTTLRPDALSVDHQTAFTLGPVREGDPSEGLVSWVWRARHEAGGVYLCRENDARDGWEDEALLFSYAGPEIVELDVAFEQNGQAVVCVERRTGPGGESEVWIYFYDPTIPGYTFYRAGPGRTPRALLDRPIEIADSDAVVFYVADHEGRIAYRQQRDRYAVEILTPIEATEDTFIEDVAKRQDRRVVLILSERDPISGTYSLRTATTTLFPLAADTEAVEPIHGITAATLEQVFRWLDTQMQTEAIGPVHSLVSARLQEPIILYTLAGEAIEPAHSLAEITLRDLIRVYAATTEAVAPAHMIAHATLVVAITIDRVLDTEAVEPAHTMTSIELQAA